MSAEGAKTASFVPEPGMLDSAADLTPVAPELPHLDEERRRGRRIGRRDHRRAEPPPAAPKPAEAPAPPLRLFDIPSPAAPVLPAIKSPPRPGREAGLQLGDGPRRRAAVRRGQAGGVREDQRRRHR